MTKKDGSNQSAPFKPLEESTPVQGPVLAGSGVVGTYDPVLKTHVLIDEKPKPIVFTFDRASVEGLLNGDFRPVAAFDIVTYTADGAPHRQSDFCLMLAFNSVKPGGTFLTTSELARDPKFKGMASERVGDLIQITKPK